MVLIRGYSISFLCVCVGGGGGGGAGGGSGEKGEETYPQVITVTPSYLEH